MKYLNNPLNIRTGSNWCGLVALPSQDKFCEFTNIRWCVRAWLRILRSYKARMPLTIHNIVLTYAPASDNNNVASYESFLYVGRTKDAFAGVVFQPHYNFSESRPIELFILCRRMCQIESNYDLTFEDFDNGYQVLNSIGD